jgi:hypothetical protein
MRKRSIGKAAGTILATVVALWLVYVVAAKVALRYLPEWASYDALELSYEEAGSWIPGRVWVRGCVVSGHDSNMQFELRVEEAQVDVALLALPFKHFHARKATVSGVEVRVRHNVEALEGQEKRLAAFPEIRGYPEPPIYPPNAGRKPPPEDAWLIEMENVSAQVKDVWAVEYRYLGPGTAKGGFRLDPGRAFHLSPSEFVWQGGEIRVGKTPVARRATGSVRAEIHLDDVQQIDGFDFADKVKVELALSLNDGELAFLNVYAGQLPLERVSGEYSADVRLRADEARLLEGTQLRAKFDDLLVTTSKVDVVSSGTLDVVATHDGDTKEVNWSPLSISLRKTVVALDGSRSEPFSATLKSNSARWLTNAPTPALQATMDVRMNPGDALLDVALGSMPSAIADAFLDMPVLQCRVAVYLTEQRSRVELLELHAGDLQASGSWQDKPAGATGGFSVKTSLVDVGIALDRRGVSWELE